MKAFNLALASSIAASSFALAGPTALTDSPAPEIISQPDATESWLTPTIDIRARLEVRDVDGFDTSTAFTTRERLGLKIGEFNGFSAFVEGEFSQAIGDDFNGGGGPDTDPTVAGNSVIADPETTELNQAYIAYKSAFFSAKVGRQRIKLNNDAFVGNVGWRQNEQTFDAAAITVNPTEDLSIYYAYSDSANRIFGRDARGGLREWKGDFHFFNAEYKASDALDITAYGVLIDFEQGFGPARAAGDTFGVIAEGKAGGFKLYGEFAYQLADLSGQDDAAYVHVKASTKLAGNTLGVGFESLGEDFYTPFATVHAFNGFADVYAGQRLGLAAHDGINDAYVFHSVKLPGGVIWKNFGHYYDSEANGGVDTSGWEYNSVLVKKFNHGITAIAKFYHYEADNDGALPTTTGFTVEANYSF